MTATAAAREAARTYVEAPNRSLALARAQQAANDVVNGRRDPHTTLTVTSPDGSSFQRCDRVTTSVRMDIPRISLPLIGGTGGTFPVSATHVEVIDPYRSGLPATAGCA
jgi:hypothetical protein